MSGGYKPENGRRPQNALHKGNAQEEKYFASGIARHT